jgi:hypothetical protein
VHLYVIRYEEISKTLQQEEDKKLLKSLKEREKNKGNKRKKNGRRMGRSKERSTGRRQETHVYACRFLYFLDIAGSLPFKHSLWTELLCVAQCHWLTEATKAKREQRESCVRDENHHTKTVSAGTELHRFVQSPASESKRDACVTAGDKMLG